MGLRSASCSASRIIQDDFHTAWRVGVKPWAGLAFIAAVYLL
jgi:hypothetical protein